VVPAQTGLADADIVILTGRVGLTVIGTTFDVAGLLVEHNAFEVRLNEIISPFKGTKV
jgi:hypothetical protein